MASAHDSSRVSARSLSSSTNTISILAMPPTDTLLAWLSANGATLHPAVEFKQGVHECG
jgi:hypothetical protein